MKRIDTGKLRSSFSLALILSVAFLGCSGQQSTVFGQTISTRTLLGTEIVNVRSQDEIWLASARDKNTHIRCERLLESGWQNSHVDQLTLAHLVDRSKPTIIYVHGNQTDDQFARSRGLQLYRHIFNRVDEVQNGPVRFVIFAWRSEREKIRLSNDYRHKLERAVHVGGCFDQFLNQFKSRDMLLLGFSLGGQVILSGLQAESALASDTVNSRPGRYLVALITPALAPEIESACLGSVKDSPLVAQTDVFFNRKDLAIRASKILLRKKRWQAYGTANGDLTFAQLTQWRTDAQFGSIHLKDISAEVGSCHSVIKYVDQSPTIRKTIRGLAYSGVPQATCWPTPQTALASPTFSFVPEFERAQKNDSTSIRQVESIQKPLAY